MPNWTYNRVTMPDVETNRAAAIFKKYCDEHGNFDFNRIIPRPKELEGTIADGDQAHINACSYIISAANPYSHLQVDGIKKLSRKDYSQFLKGFKTKLENCRGMRRDAVKELRTTWVPTEQELEWMAHKDPRPECTQTALEYADKIFTAIYKTGFADWYSWDIANWGTKWNACESDVGNGVAIFDTAWSSPAPIIAKLSELEPYTIFECTSEYEEGGVWQYRMKNGKMIYEANWEYEYDEETDEVSEERSNFEEHFYDDNGNEVNNNG